MTTEIQDASQELIKKWYERGKEAGKTDGWMTPCFDGISDEDLTGDYGNMLCCFEEGWGVTDHYHIFYGQYIWSDAKDLELERDEDGTEAFIDYKHDMGQSFWEGYHETAGTFEAWKKELRKRNLKRPK